MNSFDAAAARVQWSQECKDILEITVENLNAGYSGMRYKIEYINALVQRDAYNFWKDCSEDRLWSVLQERGLEPPASPSVDSCARLLASDDAAAEIVRVWDRMTVKQLKGALLRHSIRFGRTDTKITLINTLIRSKITKPPSPQNNSDVDEPHAIPCPTPDNIDGIGSLRGQDSAAGTPLLATSKSHHPLPAPATATRSVTPEAAPAHSLSHVSQSGTSISNLDHDPTSFKPTAENCVSNLDSTAAILQPSASTALFNLSPISTMPSPDSSTSSRQARLAQVYDFLVDMRQEQLQQILDLLEGELATNVSATSVSESQRSEYLEKLELFGMLKAIILAKSLSPSSQASRVGSTAENIVEGTTTTAAAPSNSVVEGLVTMSTPTTAPAPSLDIFGLASRGSQNLAKATHGAAGSPSFSNTGNPADTSASFIVHQETSTERIVNLSTPSSPQHNTAATPRNTLPYGSAEAAAAVVVAPPTGPSSSSMPCVTLQPLSSLPAPPLSPATYPSKRIPNTPDSPSPHVETPPILPNSTQSSGNDLKIYRHLPLPADSDIEKPSLSDDGGSNPHEVVHSSRHPDLHTALLRSFGDLANNSRNSPAASRESESQTTTNVHGQAPQGDHAAAVKRVVSTDISPPVLPATAAATMERSSADGTGQALSGSMETLVVPDNDSLLRDDGGNEADATSDAGHMPPGLGDGDGAAKDLDQEEEEATLAGISEIRDAEALVEIPELPDSIMAYMTEFGRGRPRLSQDVIDAAHALDTHHECRVPRTQHYNTFRQHVGRYYKNTRTVMKHIVDHTAAPATVTRYDNFPDANMAMQTFKIRLDIVEESGRRTSTRLAE